MTRTCAHCTNELPRDTAGRGGRQSNRKFCSSKCKDDHRNASRRRARKVLCAQCGNTRTLLTEGVAGGMCRTCAAAVGSTVARAINTRDPLERFLSMTDQDRPDGCWLWTGNLQANGYSSFYVNGRTVRAHRWAYEHFVGPISEGLQIDHLCRVRRCVNPTHLEPVTARENTRRAMRSRCVNGHPFTDENTYMHGGKRYCRTCRRNRQITVRRGAAA